MKMTRLHLLAGAFVLLGAASAGAQDAPSTASPQTASPQTQGAATTTSPMQGGAMQGKPNWPMQGRRDGMFMGHRPDMMMMRRMAMMREGAAFRFKRDGAEIDIKCAANEPTKACVDGAVTLIDKINATTPH